MKGAIRFLLKSIEKKPLITQDKELLKAYLLTILANNERSLTKACSLLVNFKNIISFSGDDISFLRQMLNTHICSGHDLEAVAAVHGDTTRNDQPHPSDSRILLLPCAHRE